MVILIILAKKKPKVINCILGKSLLRLSIDSRLNFLYICKLAPTILSAKNNFL